MIEQITADTYNTLGTRIHKISNRTHAARRQYGTFFCPPFASHLTKPNAQRRKCGGRAERPGYFSPDCLRLQTPAAAVAFLFPLILLLYHLDLLGLRLQSSSTSSLYSCSGISPPNPSPADYPSLSCSDPNIILLGPAHHHHHHHPLSPTSTDSTALAIFDLWQAAAHL